jgi:hypothetical protein
MFLFFNQRFFFSILSFLFYFFSRLFYNLTPQELNEDWSCEGDSDDIVESSVYKIITIITFQKY